MKRKLTSAALAVVMSLGTFTAAVPPVYSAELTLKDGIEYKVDFSEWAAGSYTLDDLKDVYKRQPYRFELFSA